MRWSCTPPARWSWFPPGTEGGQPAATLAAPTRTTAATPRTGPKIRSLRAPGARPGPGCGPARSRSRREVGGKQVRSSSTGAFGRDGAGGMGRAPAARAPTLPLIGRVGARAEVCLRAVAAAERLGDVLLAEEAHRPLVLLELALGGHEQARPLALRGLGPGARSARRPRDGPGGVEPGGGRVRRAGHAL